VPHPQELGGEKDAGRRQGGAGVLGLNSKQRGGRRIVHKMSMKAIPNETKGRRGECALKGLEENEWRE